MPNSAGLARNNESLLFQGERGADGEDGLLVTITFNKGLRCCIAFIVGFFTKIYVHMGPLLLGA